MILLVEHVTDPEGCRDFIFALFVRFSKKEVTLATLEIETLRVIERVRDTAEASAYADAEAAAAAEDPFPGLAEKYGCT